MRIGYSKLGRSWQLDPEKASTVGGDIDVVRLLKYLAETHPQHEFVLIGRNSGQDPQSLGYPKNVINPWTEWKKNIKLLTVSDLPLCPEKVHPFMDMMQNLTKTWVDQLDHNIVWAGQHGSANSCIPMIGTDWESDQLARPQLAFTNYCSWLLDFISTWREVDICNPDREEIWLMPDPRNYLKCREIRWPLRKPVIAQYNMTKNIKHERYGNWENLDRFHEGHREGSVWVTTSEYMYGALELTALPLPHEIEVAQEPGDITFGLIMNENRKYVKEHRLKALQEWVLNNFPGCPIYGKWTEESLLEIGRKIEPIPYNHLYSTLKTFRCTLTTPASGSGWATSKPWECFAAGTVCFFHPKYDTQGHILPKKNVPKHEQRYVDFLRVNTPAELLERVHRVRNDDGLWRELITWQRAFFEDAMLRWNRGALAIEERLGL